MIRHIHNWWSKINKCIGQGWSQSQKKHVVQQTLSSSSHLWYKQVTFSVPCKYWIKTNVVGKMKHKTNLGLEEFQLVRPEGWENWTSNHFRQEVAWRGSCCSSEHDQCHSFKDSKECSSKQWHENSPWNHESLHENIYHAVPHQDLCSVVTCIALKVISTKINKTLYYTQLPVLHSGSTKFPFLHKHKHF